MSHDTVSGDAPPAGLRARRARSGMTGAELIAAARACQIERLRAPRPASGSADPPQESTMTGAELIAAARARQIERLRAAQWILAEESSRLDRGVA